MFFMVLPTSGGGAPAASRARAGFARASEAFPTRARGARNNSLEMGKGSGRAAFSAAGAGKVGQAARLLQGVEQLSPCCLPLSFEPAAPVREALTGAAGLR